MKKKIKAMLLLVLFASSLISFSVDARHYENEGDLRLFLDYWTWVQGQDGEWTIGRITHCDNSGNNCIIGPTIEGPCD
jgi:hypothetical protein